MTKVLQKDLTTCQQHFYTEPEQVGASIAENNSQTLSADYILSYVKTFAEKHKISLLAGHSYQVNTKDGFLLRIIIFQPMLLPRTILVPELLHVPE